MLTFVLQGRYAPEALRGMIASREDPAAAARRMIKKADGRQAILHSTRDGTPWYGSPQQADERRIGARRPDGRLLRSAGPTWIC